MAFAGSKRRVLPLQVQTSLPPDDEDVAPPSAAQRSLLPPKSPLHGARGAAKAPQSGGFERMLLLRNMNVSVPISGAESSGVPQPKTATSYAPSAPVVEEISAAHNLKERKLAEARRRVEVQLMTLEDYTNTPEGEARQRRQEERARMREEELHMQRVVQSERAQLSAQQLERQAQEEARIKEMYLAKRRQEMEEQARVAQEKEAERKRVLEAKMKALKEEADRKAREEYAARQQKLADEAQAERDVRTAAMEAVLMHVEDELANAVRVEWLAEEERRRQIEAEAREWKLFEEREAERQREETQKRRDAQKEQYEQDRARRMQIHKLQQDRVRTAAADKRRREQDQQGDAVTSAASTLQRLRSQCEPTVDVPPILIAPGSPSASADQQVSPETARRNPQPTARRPPSSTEDIAALSAIAEQAHVPPPPALSPVDLVIEPLIVSSEGSEREETPADRIPDQAAVSPTSDEIAGRNGDESPPAIDDVQPSAVESGGANRVEGEEISSEPASTTSAPNTESVDENNASPEAGESQSNLEATQPSDVAVRAPTNDTVEPERPIVIQPELLSLDALRGGGVLPVAEVLSVAAGSPSSVAGLAPRDLLVEFGGITSATPKCIVAIAACVQQQVNQRIALVVLRPVAQIEGEERTVEDSVVQRCELWLVPRKWKGKGLLGCQLSPFKWPTVTSSVPIQDEKGGSGAPTSSYDALVLHQVQHGSLAYRLGLQDGDVLARCGDVDVSRAGTSATDALTVVATHLKTQWREAQRELPLVIQRWDEGDQLYSVVHVVLPVVSDSDEPLGCALTTYSQYYYPTQTTTQSISACDECYYTSLPSSLHAAALSGHVACLQALLGACSPEFFDWRDDEGRSPLFYACFARQADTARCLVTQLLASSGAYDPVSGADAYGDSPLHAAAASDCVEAIECLLETRFIADVDLANSVTQATAAHVAASEATLRVLHTRFRADLLALDADGRMPLFYACLRNDPASVAFLCELHPDFADYADSAGGNTPLHMAAWCGFGEVVRALVAFLPSIALFMPNQDGLDPRALAEQSGWRELAVELERLMVGA